MAFVDIVLKETDPMGQLRGLLKSKNLQLTCHKLGTALYTYWVGIYFRGTYDYISISVLKHITKSVLTHITICSTVDVIQEKAIEAECKEILRLIWDYLTDEQ